MMMIYTALPAITYNSVLPLHYQYRHGSDSDPPGRGGGYNRVPLNQNQAQYQVVYLYAMS